MYGVAWHGESEPKQDENDIAHVDFLRNCRTIRPAQGVEPKWNEG